MFRQNEAGSRRCFLHVGLDKTGTSALQATLKSSSLQLAKHGFFYPEVGRQHGHHVGLAKAMGFSMDRPVDVSKTKSTSSALRDELSNNALTAIISSEHFSYGVNRTNIENVRNALAEFDVKVIIYLRNQIDWFLSLYAEVIKWGYIDSIDSYANRSLVRLDYAVTVGAWASVFGKDNIIVKVYEQEGDIIQSFGSLLCGDADALPRPGKRVNDSPPALVLEALRRSNVDVPVDARRARYERMHSRMRSNYGNARLRVWPVPRIIVERIAQLELSNRRVAREFLGGSEALFPKTLRASLGCHQAATLEAAVADAVAETLAKFIGVVADLATA